MGRHNGKAKKSKGVPVGGTLTNKDRQVRRISPLFICNYCIHIILMLIEWTSRYFFDYFERRRHSSLPFHFLCFQASRKSRFYDPKIAHKHTTEVVDTLGIQSVLDQNDLGELMHIADLQQRDFAGTKGEVRERGGESARERYVFVMKEIRYMYSLS